MTRPDTVPAGATWNPEKNEWQLGTQNADGKKTDLWQYWHINKPNDVWLTEYAYTAPGIIGTQRFFNQQLQAVCETGMALPERPAGVPIHAHYVDHSADRLGVSYWETAYVDDQSYSFTGEYMMWDLSGVLTIRRVYDPITFEMTEGHQYQDGQLYSSRIIGEGTLQSIYYYRDVDPPVPRESTLYTNNEKDNTYTFYDRTGQALFYLRHEKVSKYHERRYYNSQLVYEGIRSEDPEQPPVSVNYYYPDGLVMISYHSNRDGTGYWQLYEENGDPAIQLPVPEEEDYKQWSKFLSKISDYKPTTTKTEWEQVKEAFHTKYTKDMLGVKLAALPVPAFVQAALDRFNWEQIDTAMGGGSTLPMYINGLLAEDPEIAKFAAGKIWMEIAHQGSVYEATYATGSIVATAMPHLPVIRERLLDFLFSVLALEGIAGNKKYYKQLVTPLAACRSLLEEYAHHTDDVIALKALYLLHHAGEGAVIKETWQNSAHTLFRRSYALFSLGALYIRSNQIPVLIGEFTAALETADEKLIRLILAIHLVAATKTAAQAAWLAVLIDAATTPEDVGADFNELHPFIGDYDVQEYVLMVLGFANPDTLAQHIIPVIDMLPTVHALKQETLLYVIFAVLFPKKAALKAITPVRQQALLAAAAVLEKGADFVNINDIFRKYGLPAHAGKLRQLAVK